MNSVFLLGLAFGALIGTLATDSTLNSLREDANRAFSAQRWKAFLDKTGSTLPTRIIWAATRMLPIELLTLLVAGLLIALTAVEFVYSYLVSEIFRYPRWIHGRTMDLAAFLD